MNKLSIALLLSILWPAAGCSTIKSIQEGVEDTKRIVTEIKAVYVDAKDKADTNKDGVTTSDEWKAWLIGGGALTVLTSLAGILKSMSVGKQVVAVSKEQDELWEKTHKPSA